MKSNIVPEFPDWWLYNHLSRITKRRFYYFQAHGGQQYRISKPTWSQWHNRSKGKMRRRFEKYISGLAFDEWKMAITYQIGKVHRQYDLIHLWGLCEYYICRKVNNESFPRDSIPNQLWKYKALQIIKEISKRRKLKGKLLRSVRYTWDKLISNSRIKFQQPFQIKLSEEYKLWGLCFKTNFGKVQDYWESTSWHPRIHNNILKIERMRNIIPYQTK